MAKNIRYDKESVPCIEMTVASGVVSGDPVEISAYLHGTALTTRDANGKATVKLHCLYIAEYTVEAKTGAGNSAVALGEQLFYDGAETIKLNKDSTNGYYYGVALGAVTSGSSGTIPVAVGAVASNYSQAPAVAAISTVGANAITIPTRDTRFFITAATPSAMTLVDPTAGTHDGLRLEIISTTAQAHTLSNAAGSGFNAAGAGGDVATFAANIGNNIILEAYGGKWLVVSSVGITLG